MNGVEALRPTAHREHAQHRVRVDLQTDPAGQSDRAAQVIGQYANGGHDDRTAAGGRNRVDGALNRRGVVRDAVTKRAETGDVGAKRRDVRQRRIGMGYLRDDQDEETANDCRTQCDPAGSKTNDPPSEIFPGSHSDDASFGLSRSFGSTRHRPVAASLAHSIPNACSGVVAQNFDKVAQHKNNLARHDDNLVSRFRLPCIP